MTFSEFKAWLDGYSVSFVDGTPNAEQWEEIRGKLWTVSITQPIRNYDDYRRTWIVGDTPPYWQFETHTGD